MKIRYRNGKVIINYSVNGFLGCRIGIGVGETTRGAARAVSELLKAVA